MRADGWVIDSDYRRKLGTLVLERADTVVWLDLPLHVCMRRLWGRTLPRIRNREELWNGNRESWRAAFWGWDSLFVYAIRKHVGHRRRFTELLARPELAHLEVVRLRSPAAVEAWLGTIPPAAPSTNVTRVEPPRAWRASIPQHRSKTSAEPRTEVCRGLTPGFEAYARRSTAPRTTAPERGDVDPAVEPVERASAERACRSASARASCDGA